MPNTFIKGKDLGLMACSVCQLVLREREDGQCCPRCHSQLHIRKQNSVKRTWALLISAIIMYIPANTQPVMHTSYLGRENADTIIGGVIYFIHHGEWPLAVVIFAASVIIPLLKMMSLVFLLISVKGGSNMRQKQRTKLYRIIELMGRWSMVDVYVVALMVALVQLGALASIIPGYGAVAFSSVVVLTMFATMSFDPRLIWDRQD